MHVITTKQGFHPPPPRNVGDIGARGRGKEERREEKKEDSTQKIPLSTVFPKVKSETSRNNKDDILCCPTHNQKSGVSKGGGNH
jgi:hypothetical protein